MKVNNNSGFSLVSVMIAIGLTGGLALILVNLSEQQNKIAKKGFIDNEMNEVLAHFNSMLVKKESCTANFVGQKKGTDLTEFRYSFEPDAEPFARKDDGDGIDEKEDYFRGTKIRVTQMRILTDEEFKAAYNRSPELGLLAFQVTFKKPDIGVGGKEFKKLFELRVRMGEGDFVSAVTQSDLTSECDKKLGSSACLIDLDTTLCEETNLSKSTFDLNGAYTAFCVKLSSAAEAVVLGCE
jgi:hypothetical protein